MHETVDDPPETRDDVPVVMQRQVTKPRSPHERDLKLWANAYRPSNRKTHLLDRRSGKSRQKKKSAKVPLIEVRKCSMTAETSEKVYCVPCCAECEDQFLCEDTTLEP